MFSSQSAELSLDTPCRVVAAVAADRMDNRFLIGSSRVVRKNNNNHHHSTNPNRLYACRFHAELNELGLDASFVHPTGPVQSMACSPTNVTLVATSSQLQNNATLWKLSHNVMTDTNGLRYEDSNNHHDSSSSNNNNHNNNNTVHDDGLGGASSSSSSSKTVAMEALATLPSSSGQPISHMSWRQPLSLLESVESSSPSSLSTSLGSSAAAGDLLTVDRLGLVQLWDVERETSVTCTRTTPSKKTTRPHNDPSHDENYNTTNLDDDTTTSLAHNNLGIPPRVVWDPHAAGGTSAAVTTTQGRVVCLDWRTDPSIPIGTVSDLVAHRSAAVIDLDYNPNKPYVLATCGTDSMLRFWDLRLLGSKQQPLLVCRGGHDYWIWNVLYNPFHDQLVLSTGTADTLANLWRVSSISSAPPLLESSSLLPSSSSSEPNHGVGGDASSSFSSWSENARVASYEHADACYGAAWGAADAWVYTTVGYEGKVVLHHVPSKEKYKILL
ncbi:hypothetical protein ACA910_012573 [Epithemia clementina (nom. ined.)]